MEPLQSLVNAPRALRQFWLDYGLPQRIDKCRERARAKALWRAVNAAKAVIAAADDDDDDDDDAMSDGGDSSGDDGGEDGPIEDRAPPPPTTARFIGGTGPTSVACDAGIVNSADSGCAPSIACGGDQVSVSRLADSGLGTSGLDTFSLSYDLGKQI